MKHQFLLLVLTSTFIWGMENDGDNLPMKEKISPGVLPFETVHTDCGGVIPLSPLFQSHINYKYGKLYDPFEFCVWTLAPEDSVTNIQVTVKQNISDAWDGVTIYFPNAKGLTSIKLPQNNTVINLNTSLAFLVFYSNEHDQQNGVFIEIYSTGETGTTSSAAYHFRKDEGEFSYPSEEPTANPDKLLGVVLQKKTLGLVDRHLRVNLKNVTIDADDSILVYTFNEYYKSANIVPVGRFTAASKFQVHCFYPLLILWESKNNDMKGKGFHVEWKPFTYSIE